MGGERKGEKDCREREERERRGREGERQTETENLFVNTDLLKVQQNNTFYPNKFLKLK